VRWWTSVICAVGCWMFSGLALAEEPWSDADPPEPHSRHALGDIGFRGGAEYRANWLYINPISLNSEQDRRASWIEHRLRVDAAFDYKDKIRIVSSADILDGVLWGDNGTITEEPKADVGTNISARVPNVTRACVKYRSGDPLDASSYAYGLCSQDQMYVRRLYGEVMLPFGLLRVGRQPTAVGQTLQGASGDGRANRFGFARRGNSVDRILFATKPLEGFKPKGERNLSATEGVFLAFLYDRIAGDEIRLFRDDVHQAGSALRWLQPRLGAIRDLEVTTFYVHRWEKQFNSDINVFGLRSMARFGDLFVGVDSSAIVGTTREVAAAYTLITNDPVVDQTIKQLGARAVVRYDRPFWSGYLEFDYASGDGDPRPGTPLTQFRFAEDNNVGLLLFKHILAFQSARAAAAGVETLRRLGAQSYPPENVDSRGAFTNAIAVFPQFDIRPHPNLLLRGGALFAWSQAAVNDPVQSLQNRDGLTIQDDLVNFVGGKAGRYYGTELDGRIQWRFEEHFLFDLESAILFPGEALQDKNGNAVRSVLVQGRTTFFFL
jgi:hypothetical protein